MRTHRRLATLALLSLVACSGDDSAPPTTPGPSPTPQFTITITPTGLDPAELSVPQGARVLFVNKGTRRRSMQSNPHPEHDDCLEINNVGTLNTGDVRETGNLNVVRTCAFHDDDEPGNAAVQGRIIIRP